MTKNGTKEIVTKDAPFSETYEKTTFQFLPFLVLWSILYSKFLNNWLVEIFFCLRLECRVFYEKLILSHGPSRLTNDVMGHGSFGCQLAHWDPHYDQIIIIVPRDLANFLHKKYKRRVKVKRGSGTVMELSLEEHRCAIWEDHQQATVHILEDLFWCCIADTWNAQNSIL